MNELMCNPDVPNFKHINGVINGKNWQILVEWMLEVSAMPAWRDDLLPETVFLGVALLNRFLVRAPTLITISNLQLYGITSMILASKMEQRYPIPSKDWIVMTADSYTKLDVVVAEEVILKALEYRTIIPTAFMLLTAHPQSNERIVKQACFLLTMSLQDHRLMMIPDSTRVEGAVFSASCSLYPDRILLLSTLNRNDRLAAALIAALHDRILHRNRVYGESKLFKNLAGDDVDIIRTPPNMILVFCGGT